MYRTLFDLAGPAILAWALLIFLPTWRVTRRVAESAAFPAYLAALYVAGIVLVFREHGPGMMREFGSADGVLRLLRTESVALVAWIHILAFDQVVGLLIYRDNMRHRIVPLPVQSVILVATLMLGPVGFISYWALRMMRPRAELTAWGERDRVPLVEPAAPVRLADVTQARSLVGIARDLLARERALVATALVGVALAGACAVIAALNGGWRMGVEGRLMEAAKFDVAVAIYLVTLAAFLPLAGFGAPRHRRYVQVLVALTAYAFLAENVPNWLGYDPRFSRIAPAWMRIAGAAFFLSALGIMWRFFDMASEFFRRDAIPDHPLLRDALRYATVAAAFAFGVGILMSAISSRQFGGAGNVMPVHAAGFHGLQALPVVALWLGWSALDAQVARRILHAAGLGWVLLCAGLTLEALMGQAPMSGGVGTAVAVLGATAWATCAGLAWRASRAGMTQATTAA